MSDVSEDTHELYVTCANEEYTSVKNDSIRQTPSLQNIGEEQLSEDEDNDEDEGYEKADNNSDEDEEQLPRHTDSPVSEARSHRSERSIHKPLSSIGVRSTVNDRPTYSVPYNRQTFSEYVKSAPARQKSVEEIQEEKLEKQQMITDLQRLRDHHNVTLSRDWCMNDDIDDMSFELKRIMLHIDETNNVAVMRNGLQMACTGIEMLSKKFKVLDLDGWSAEVCADMSQHDRALARLYRKYWRRTHSSSPEADLALSLIGSMGMFHMRKTVSKKMFQQAPKRAEIRRPTVTSFDDDDDEDLPPMRGR